MRILVHDFSGHPFQAQLSRELARRQHDVLHLSCASYRSGKGALERRASDPPNFEVDAIDLGENFDKYSPWRRVRQEVRYARMLGERAARFEPDVVLSTNTPLFAQARFMRWCDRERVPCVFWQQDVYSVAMGSAARKRLPIAGHLLGAFFAAMERRLVRRSAAVVCITEDFLPVLARWKVPPGAVRVIENWAPLEEMPQLPRANPWRTEQQLADRKVVLYAGTLGMKHNPRLLLELARALDERDDSEMVVVSQGLGADWLRAAGARLGVRSLRVLDFQPYSRLPEVLATADILVTILEPSAGIFSVPSKVLTYHCAGRPLLAAVPRDNLCARIIETAGSGIVADPADAGDFVAKALQLLDDEQQCRGLGAAARQYADDTFDITRIGDAFGSILAAADADRPGRVGTMQMAGVSSGGGKGEA
jgi:colanic acid biosynthesis glycosyl transferase WcaI